MHPRPSGLESTQCTGVHSNKGSRGTTVQIPWIEPTLQVFLLAFKCVRFFCHGAVFSTVDTGICGTMSPTRVGSVDKG